MHSVFILEQTEYNYFSENRILKLELEQTNNDCVLCNVVSDATYCYCRVAWSVGLSVCQSSHSSAKLAESIVMLFGFRAREPLAGSRAYKLGSWFNGRRRWPVHVRYRRW